MIEVGDATKLYGTYIIDKTCSHPPVFALDCPTNPSCGRGPMT